MKKLVIAALTAILSLTYIFLVDIWYQIVPAWYLTEEQSIALMGGLIMVGYLTTDWIVEKIDEFISRKKEEKVKVNWLTVDED